MQIIDGHTLRSSEALKLNDIINNQAEIYKEPATIKTKSTEKNRVRYRNDICNHWDLDYLSMEEIEKKLETNDPITTIPKKKKESG